MNKVARDAGQRIAMQREQLSKTIVDRQWELDPQLATRYDEVGREKCVRDVRYNLEYLAQAVTVESPTLFVLYIAWVKVLFQQLEIPTADLVLNLQATKQVLLNSLPDKEAELVGEYIDVGLEHISHAPATIPSFLDPEMPLAALAQQYLSALLEGRRHAASQAIMDAVVQGVRIQDLYLQVFQTSQYEIGRLWQTNKISVAQEHYCTAAAQLIMSQLYPQIFTDPKNGRRLIAVCASQELHEIGLRMVTDFFEMEGWDTRYLGANMPTESIVQTAREWNADILAISATMTFHINTVIGIIEQVRSAIPQLKIFVGGYPFNLDPELWRRVGADAYASDASEAVTVANSLLAANEA